MDLSPSQLRALWHALLAAPSRLSVAADTTARPPGAPCVVRLLCPDSQQLSLTVHELDYAAGGLGFRLFPAALWLSAWLAALPSTLLTSLTAGGALELGAGLGLPGLTLAARLKERGQTVTLSDFAPELLKAMAAAAAAHRLDNVAVAFCDWSCSRSTSAAFSPAANPELGRVQALAAAAAASGELAAALAVGATFSFILATEILYEPHAAVCVADLLAARLARGGRFITLMAVRDAAIVAAFLQRCAAHRLRTALRPVAALPPPPGDAAQCAAQAEATALRHADSPLLPMLGGGGWSEGDGASDWQPLLSKGLAACSVEVMQVADPSGAPPPSGPCCSRRARGLACPCRRTS